MHSSRHLTWDGCVNVRDLGGLPTEDGAETTYGAVVRADYIGALSDAGRQALLEHGITRIVDLRWFAERVEDPPLELGIETLHVPLFGDENDRYHADRLLLDRIPDHAECRRVMYLEHLDAYRDRVATAFAAVSSAPEGCVLLHCMGGVDRTGLIAALLLRVVGVPRETVAEDFGLSRANWAPHAPEWIGAAGDEREREFRRFLAAMPAESMLGVLTELEGRYGGAEGYLRAAGLPEAEIARARGRLRP